MTPVLAQTSSSPAGRAAPSGRAHKELYLPEHLRACRTGGDCVLLDLQRNRYFGLGDRHADALMVLASNVAPAPSRAPRMHLSDAAAYKDALLAARLLCEERPERAHRNAPDAASGLASVGYQLDAAAPLRTSHLLAAATALAWASHALKRRTLLRVVRDLDERSSRVDATAASTQWAIELTNTFRRMRPYLYSARGRCLLHALTLRRFLCAFGVNASWIIGVRTRPWAAHSWVQYGSLLLDGRPEDVCDYSPILVA